MRKVSKISPKKTKSSAAAKIHEIAEGAQPGPQIDAERFYQAVIERRISDAEKELDAIRTTIPATEGAKGYMKGLEGLLLTAKSTDDRYLYLSKVEKTPTKLKTLRREFAAQGTNVLHSDYDRGFFLALETYMRKLERSSALQEKVGDPAKPEH